MLMKFLGEKNVDAQSGKVLISILTRILDLMDVNYNWFYKVNSCRLIIFEVSACQRNDALQ